MYTLSLSTLAQGNSSIVGNISCVSAHYSLVRIIILINNSLRNVQGQVAILVKGQVLLALFELYGNLITITAVNLNAVACAVGGVGISCIDGVDCVSISFVRCRSYSNVIALIDHSLGCLCCFIYNPQLGNVNCICIICTCCHVHDLTGMRVIICIAANRYCTKICLPGKVAVGIIWCQVAFFVDLPVSNGITTQGNRIGSAGARIKANSGSL